MTKIYKCLNCGKIIDDQLILCCSCGTFCNHDCMSEYHALSNTHEECEILTWNYVKNVEIKCFGLVVIVQEEWGIDMMPVRDAGVKDDSNLNLKIPRSLL